MAAAGYDPVLLDLDGTVIDSVALIRESHRHAVREVLGRDLPDEVLTANVGRPLLDQMRVFDADRADELVSVYRAWNLANHHGLLAAYPRIDAALARLREAGRRVGVVTSKSRATVELAFHVLGLEAGFDVLVAHEDTARHKPDPAPLLAALELLGADPDDACYVGDAPFDLRAARAAGVAPVAVTWGFFTRETLLAETPDAVVDTPEQLVDVCLGLR